MVDRRTFLKQAGSFASAALVLPPMQKPARYKIGLQLFTVNRDMNRDPIASLDRVAEMGYEEVETYGIDPEALTYYRLPAAEFAKRLQDRNLPTPSGHYDLQKFLNASTDDLNRYVDRCAEGARILGQRYIVWPYIEPRLRTLDTYKHVAGLLNAIGSRLAKSGLHVAYHNGGGEFIAQTGQLPYDIILRETDPALVKLQIDLYWHAHDTDDPPHALFKGRRALCDVAREGHAQGQPRLHRTWEWHHRLHADLARRRHVWHDAFLRRARRQLRRERDAERGGRHGYVKKYLKR